MELAKKMIISKSAKRKMSSVLQTEGGSVERKKAGCYTQQVVYHFRNDKKIKSLTVHERI